MLLFSRKVRRGMPSIPDTFPKTPTTAIKSSASSVEYCGTVEMMFTPGATSEMCGPVHENEARRSTSSRAAEVTPFSDRVRGLPSVDA